MHCTCLSVDKNKKVEEYSRKIKRLDTWISTSAENGLFKVQTEVTMPKIAEKLRNATKHIESDPPNFPECDYELNTAASLYFDAIHETKLSWRLRNVYAVHHFIYLVFLLMLVFVFYNNFHIDSVLQNNFAIPKLAVDAAAWGVVGAVLRGFWGLWNSVNDRSYRNAWFIWFISLPFIGGILGTLVYLVITAGLIIISTDPEANNITNGVVNPTVVIVSSAFAGFNWEWAIKQVERLKVGNP